MNKTNNNYLISDEEFQHIKDKVYRSIGVNLTDAKRALVVSRLSRRLKKLGFEKFSQYFQYVDENSDEADILYNLITTNVTNFFREKHHFIFLKDQFFPELIRQKAEYKNRKVNSKNKVRIWSAACSSGEEPYSIAMTSSEFFANHKNWQIEILASDINLDVLAKAKSGIYSEKEIKGIPYNLLKKYFMMGTGENNGKFKVKNKLKELITFKRINLNSRQYPISKQLDVIFCRNVFIYFDQNTQKDILDKFYQYLLPGGILFLGHSESILKKELLSGRWKNLGQTIYQREG